MKDMKKKIKRLRLLVMMLFALGSSFVVTENFYAWDDTSARYKAAELNGWSLVPSGYPIAGTHWINKSCTLDGQRSLYFAAWVERPTCETGGRALVSCYYANSVAGPEESYIHQQNATYYYNQGVVGPLGHEFTSNYSSYTVGNNGAGDGYWWRKCSHCDKWGKTSTPISYTIRFSDTHITGKSDSGTMSDMKLTYDKASALTTNVFQKTGHRFLGWATSSQGDVVYTDAQQVKNLTVTDGAVITLYAVFEPIEFTITYDSCGGIIEGTTESILTTMEYYDNPVNLSVKAQKNGLVHIGWALTQDAPIGLSSMQMPAGDITLHAVYSLPVSDMKEALYVVWDKNNPGNFRTYPLDLINVDPSGYSYSKANIQALNELGLVSEDEADWGVVLYDNAGNSATLHNNTPIPKRYLQTVIHYVWDIEKQEFIYHTTTDELAYEGETYTPAYISETEENYPFGYAPSNIDGAYVVAGDTTTSAYYMPIEYKLYFDENGGFCETEYKSVYVNYYYGELPVATREGYDFVGWFTDPVGGIQIRNTDIYTTPGDSKVYAHWEVHKHTVVYDFWTNGGNDCTAYTKEFDYGTAVDLSVQASKYGWEFVGWSIYPDATTGLTELPMGDEDIVLYAIFKKVITVTFIDMNVDTLVSREVSTTIYGTKEQGSILVPEQNTYTGWNSLGWCIDKDVGAEVMASSGTTIYLSENAVYYGLYGKEITLSYDTNGSAWEIPPVTLEALYNSSGSEEYPEFLVSAPPELDNHSFVAWVELNENNEVVASYEGNTEVLFKKDTVLTAKWDKYPEIEAYDRYFTLEDAQNGLITEEKLLEKVNATDKEDGVLSKGTGVTVVDFSSLDFLSGEEIEVTYRAVDSFGNVVTKSITVHVVDTTVKVSPTIYYTRFISPRFYSDGENLVAAENGGLEETSVWRTNETYSRLLGSSMAKKKLNEEYKIIDSFGLNTEVKVAGSGEWEDTQETWVFSKEDIEAIKEFVNEHGYGNIKEPGAIDLFLEQFGRCKQ